MLQEVIADCPGCGESFVLDVDVTSEPEQSLMVSCPACCSSLEVFVRCEDGEVKSISVSMD